MTAQSTQPLTSVEVQLCALLLVSAGLSPGYVQNQLPRFTKYLSGDVPSTVLRLGNLDFPYPVDPRDWIVAEMVFEMSGKHVAWWLLRYETGECEIEILVNGNSEPWFDAPFPDILKIAVKHPSRLAKRKSSG